jgi:predicted ATPase/DNA-binding CsgD family transcriptional regulator
MTENQPTAGKQEQSLPLSIVQFPNLPVQPTPLIGREQEVEVACALLQLPEVRLLTLTGPGGVGKTRLALQLAANLQDTFVSGVCFIPLAIIRDADLVVPNIAQVLELTDIREAGELSLLERLIKYLREKHILLLLDNFEQVVTAAPTLAEMLAACRYLKILVTSRAVLHIRGEHEFSVRPLALPDLKNLPDSETLTQFASVALFIQRSQAALPDFKLKDSNARAIAEICTYLDGLPLAIELAAVRIKLLPPQALLARLEHRLQLLTGGAKDAPVRHQTLWNTLAWSYNLLDVNEQRLFQRLSVFVGGCALDAVEAVCNVAYELSLPVLDIVASLLDKSLLQQVERENNEPRLLMLETIREYGLECLAASGELDVTRHAHAAFYLALAEEAEPYLTGAEEGQWLERLQKDNENLRAALHWSLRHGNDDFEDSAEIALRLAGALWRFWWARGFLHEGRNFLAKALSMSEKCEPSARAKALNGAGMLAFYQDDYDQAEKLCGESFALFRELDNKLGVAASLNLLGQVAAWRSNYQAAASLEAESLALYREIGDMWGIASSLGTLASVTITRGEFAKACILAEEGLALFRQSGDTWGIAFALHHLARGKFLQGMFTNARELGEESLAFFREVGDKGAIAYALALLGQIVLYQEDDAKASMLLEESLALQRELEDRWGLAQSLSILAKVTAFQSDNAKARALYRQSLDILGDVGDKQLIASCLEGLAYTAVSVTGVQRGMQSNIPSREEIYWAVRLLGAAEQLRKAIGAPLPPIELVSYKDFKSTTRSQLGDAVFKAAWREGQNLLSAGVSHIVILQLMQVQDSIPVRVAYPAGLTQREVDVIRLVAQGLTDVQVADELVLSTRTVSTHLRSIYHKLGVSSRSAATRFAVERQLV